MWDIVNYMPRCKRSVFKHIIFTLLEKKTCVCLLISRKWSVQWKISPLSIFHVQKAHIYWVKHLGHVQQNTMFWNRQKYGMYIITNMPPTITRRNHASSVHHIYI